MICIHSNEKLIFQNLLAAFHNSGEQPQFFYAESDNSVWLEMETLLEKVTNKQVEDEFTYYFVIDHTTDPFDIYAHIKMVWQYVRGFVSSQVSLHIIVTYTNEQIGEIERIDLNAKILYKKLQNLNSKKPSRFQLDIKFHFIYNPFGDSSFVSINECCTIQQFININNLSEKGIYLSVDPELKITGTDVKEFCDNLVKSNKKILPSGSPDIFRDTMLIPKPILVHDLVSRLKMGTFAFEKMTKEQTESDKENTILSRLINWESNTSIADQIFEYIKTDNDRKDKSESIVHQITK